VKVQPCSNTGRDLFLRIPDNFVGAGGGGCGPFFQQKPSQGAQVIEQPTAALQVPLQFVQLELHDLQCLHPALRLGLRGRAYIGYDLPFGFGDGLDQQAHVLMGILDTIERGLEGTVHGKSSSANARGLWRN
jgi:hypothetical protein